MTERTVVLFTGQIYTAFIQTEIAWMRKLYPTSVIVTDNSNLDKDRYPNTYKVDFNAPRMKLVRHIAQHAFEIAGLLIKDLISKRSSWPYLLAWRQRLSTLIRCSCIEQDLYQDGVIGVDRTCYAYFANEYALILALAVRRGHLSKFSMRAHGRDVIEDREPRTAKLPFQAFKYQYAEHIYCVSEATGKYIKHLYPSFSSKVETSYLGTMDHGLGPLSAPSEQVVLISIGRVRNVKRFYLIAEMLQYVDVPIKWVHVGDVAKNDPTYARFEASLKVLDNKPNIDVEMLGFMDNEALMQYYQKKYVDVIINTSEHEGLPVSIQEAISFGIPAMATDVGGTSDIVNEATGVLLSANPNPEEMARSMIDFITNHARSRDFRVGVRTYWEDHFNGAVNYPVFFNTLAHRDY